MFFQAVHLRGKFRGLADLCELIGLCLRGCGGLVGRVAGRRECLVFLVELGTGFSEGAVRAVLDEPESLILAQSERWRHA